MQFSRVLVAALVVSAFSLAACHPNRHEGPAERAGEKIDKGLNKMGEKMEEGGQKLQDKARGD
jgi:predicted small secreted protein